MALGNGSVSRRSLLLLATAAAGVTVAVAYAVQRRRKRRPAVLKLLRYPVKSCGQDDLARACVLPRGFEGDREFQVTDADGKYCTPRDEDKARLFQIRCKLTPRLLTLCSPGGSPDLHVDRAMATRPVDVKVLCAPSMQRLQDFGEEAAAWLQDATGIEGCRLSGIGAGYSRTVQYNPKQEEPVPMPNAPLSLADEAPFLLTTTASLKDLNQRLVAKGEAPVDMNRFRPNIVLEGSLPWEEDCWKRIRIGDVEFSVWQRCARCVMTTIDPDTLQRGKEPLVELAKFRKRDHGTRNFGMHLVPHALPPEGLEIAIGASLEVLEFDEKRRSEWEKLHAPEAKEEAEKKAREEA